MIFVTIVTFGPFYDHLPQVFSRLFPFKRGLCHAYWAPNFWALYSFADRLLLKFAKLVGLADTIAANSWLTRGLVGDSTFSILPNITPLASFALTAIFQLPSLFLLANQRNFDTFLDSLILCGFGSFIFGWHVHEKAILMVLIPITFALYRSANHRRIAYIALVAGYFSLLPLIFTTRELIIKTTILAIYLSLTAQLLFGARNQPSYFRPLERAYLLGFGPIYVVTEIIFPFQLFGSAQYPFLPLMLTSVYSAVGIMYSAISYYRISLASCWHVHGNSILMVLIPFTFDVYRNANRRKVAYITLAAGYFSLLPLLFTTRDLIVKSAILAIYVAFAAQLIVAARNESSYFQPLERTYILGFGPLYVATEIIFSFQLFGSAQYSFLQLMLTSVYSALGIMYTIKELAVCIVGAIAYYRISQSSRK